jgi:hypothetical protein
LFKLHGFISLQHSYERYNVFLAAHELMIKMGKDGTWGGKLPVKNDLMEVFTGRSTFYLDYIKLFDTVHAYPVLLSWLVEEKGAPSAAQLFGGGKRTYGFRELREYLRTLHSPTNPCGLHGLSTDCPRTPPGQPGQSINNFLTQYYVLESRYKDYTWTIPGLYP